MCGRRWLTPGAAARKCLYFFGHSHCLHVEQLTSVLHAREICYTFGPGWLTLGAAARKYR
jgi:hypothetical protein